MVREVILAETKKVTDISSARTPDWQKIKAIYEQGGSDPEVARALNITMRKFYELVEDVQAFSEFVELGQTMSKAWWYEQGRLGLSADKFNGPLYNANMKNRFGWTDRTETTSNEKSTPANADELKVQLAQVLKKLVKTHPELLSTAKEVEDNAQ